MDVFPTLLLINSEQGKIFAVKTWRAQKLDTNNLEGSRRWNNEEGRIEIKQWTTLLEVSNTITREMCLHREQRQDINGET